MLNVKLPVNRDSYAYFAFDEATISPPEYLMNPVRFGKHGTKGQRKACRQEKGSCLQTTNNQLKVKFQYCIR